MAPQQIVDALHAAGLMLALTPDRAVKVVPASRLTPDLRDLIRQNKPALIDWLAAANDSPELDRWCWPLSEALNGAEIDCLVSRVELFVSRGLSLIEATAAADKLVVRDRDADDRAMCMECKNLSGRRCSAWRSAGVGGPSVGDLVLSLQRCPAFLSTSSEAPQ